jgi:chromosome segregation ATPase
MEQEQPVDRIAQRHDGSSSIAAAPGCPRAVAACVSAALIVGALALLPAPGARAATYKWVDDKGVVHYTDKIPLEAMNKGNVELDKNAVPIRKTDPPLSAEQRRLRAEEEARLQQLAKERELVDRRDRALLATYTMESEIDLARKRALTTIDAQVQSSSAYSVTLNKRKDEVETKVRALGDKPVPPVLERELASISAELAKQSDLIAAKQKEISTVNARYDADKKRWKELRAATEAMSGGAGARATPTSAQK